MQDTLEETRRQNNEITKIINRLLDSGCAVRFDPCTSENKLMVIVVSHDYTYVKDIPKGELYDTLFEAYWGRFHTGEYTDIPIDLPPRMVKYLYDVSDERGIPYNDLVLEILTDFLEKP
jgi:hypothetical protein